MTRTTAWRALAAALTASCVTLAPAVPAFAMVPAIEAPPAPPVAEPPRGPLAERAAAFWRRLAREHPEVARFQMPAVKEIGPRRTAADGTRPRRDARRRPRATRSPGHAGQATRAARVVAGDPPADRPSSSAARFTTADLAAAAPLSEASTGGRADGLAGVIGGGIATIVLVAFAGYRLRPRPGRGRARS